VKVAATSSSSGGSKSSSIREKSPLRCMRPTHTLGDDLLGPTTTGQVRTSVIQ